MQTMAVMQTIPADLTGIPFLKASHFRLDQDQRLHDEAMRSIMKRHFPPHWGILPLGLILPPRAAKMFHEDRSKIKEFTSETLHQYGPKKIGEKFISSMMLQATNYKTHKDPRIKTFKAMTATNFTYPSQPQQPVDPELSDILKKSSISFGDKEKIRVSSSDFRSSYVGHDVTVHPKTESCQLLGGEPTIRGDQDSASRYDSDYKAKFQGQMTKPPDPFEKQTLSCLVFGDPIQINELSTRQKSDYQPHEGPFQRFDRQQALSDMTKTNFNTGDGENRFSTTAIEGYGCFKADFADHVGRKYPVTSIPGDKNLDTMCTWTTTHHRDYTQLEPKEQETLEDKPWVGKKSNLHFGEKKLMSNFYNTSHGTAFQPPEPTRVKVSSRANLESSVPLHFYKDVKTLSEAHLAFVPHKERMTVSEEKLLENKKSHIILPWRGHRFLSTTHQRSFTPKYMGPPNFCKTDFQASHLPLGTLGQYIPGCYNAFAN